MCSFFKGAEVNFLMNNQINDHSVWLYIIIGLTVITAVSIFVFKRLNRKNRISDVVDSPSLAGQFTEDGHEMSNLTNVDRTQRGAKQIEDDGMNKELVARLFSELTPHVDIIAVQLKELMHDSSEDVKSKSKLLAAYRSSLAVLNACNQFVAINKHDFRGVNLKIASYSIVNVVDLFVASMVETFNTFPIKFHYSKNVSNDFHLWIDKKEVDFILHNLLINSLARMSYEGQLLLGVELVRDGVVDYCALSITNIQRNEVMEKYNINHSEIQIDRSQVSLDMVYDAVRKRIELHHGVMNVTMLEVGVTVKVLLPVGKRVYEEDPNVEFIVAEDISRVVEDTSNCKEDIISGEGAENAVVDGEESKKTLLVIEDYADIRLFLKAFFQRDYNVLLACNGAEGAEIAKREIPDLIMCDVMMPVMDGYECCRLVKDALETCHIPFIMLTAMVQEDNVIKGLECGVDDYILKPFIPKILKAKVKNLIDGRINLKKAYTKLLTSSPDEVVAVDDNQEENKLENPFISTVIKTVERSMQESDFSVKKLASDLNMSQPTLYRKVKQHTDFTIIELIRGVRMRKASTLLKAKTYTVQEVAEMVGYNDVPTFRKHFVDAYGFTPSTYADSKS